MVRQDLSIVHASTLESFPCAASRHGEFNLEKYMIINDGGVVYGATTNPLSVVNIPQGYELVRIHQRSDEPTTVFLRNRALGIFSKWHVKYVTEPDVIMPDYPIAVNQKIT